MAHSPYAIRKGFEYQDLVCACELLSELDTGSLDVEFQIESDTVHHIDDLVVYPDASSVVARQVKFHVDQDHVETFKSLIERRTKGSRSILEKLYRGWKQLKEAGRTSITVEFISSNPAERGRYNLAPAIETGTRRFKDKFFSHADFQSPLAAFTSNLGVAQDEVRAFLSDVEWRFSYESIDALRRLTAKLLRRLRLPYDDDAVSRLIELVGAIATSRLGKLRLRDLVQRMWSLSRFRDACEQRFNSIDFGSTQQRRANSLTVAVVALEAIPSFTGSRCACLEEPFPFPDFRHGITATDREGLLDRHRLSWRQEYIKWQSQRVSAVLDAISSHDVDIVVFPRFSLPLEVAGEVANWGKANQVHCVIGGHSLPSSEKERELYPNGLNVALPSDDSGQLISPDTVIDAVLRFDRTGRCSVSELDSPHSKTERVLAPTDTIFLELTDGWVSGVTIPSKAVATDFAKGAPARPELAIVSAGVHASVAVDDLSQYSSLFGMPVIVASSDVNLPPTAFTLDAQAPSLRHADAWEGFRIFRIDYDRSHLSWEADVAPTLSLPLVYHRDKADFDPAAFEELRGAPASRLEAIARLQRGDSLPGILFKGESPAEFFLRRAMEANGAIRDQLANASPSQIQTLGQTLTAINDSLEQLRQQSFLPLQFSPPPQTLVPVRSSQFFNRAKEKSDIGRFLSVTGNKSILLLHGPPGIGKRELLSEVQRLQRDRRDWTRFRCTPDSRLSETVVQLIARLGAACEVPAQADRELFGVLASALEAAGTTVLVLEDAHCLPIASDHQDHVALLDLLSFFSSDSLRPVKLILLSDWLGNLDFSGSHRLEKMPLEGLADEYIVEMLQEHLAETPCRYGQPSVDELGVLTAKLHGHPFLARLAAVVLEESTVSDVAQKLYTRVETRNFVLDRLLAGVSLSEREQRFLEFAAILRAPVPSEAFGRFEGPASNILLQELLKRFLMLAEDARYRLHPVLTEFFSAGLQNSESLKKLHSTAFDFYSALSQRRALTVDERVEYVYHGVASGKPIDLAHMQMFAGSIRSALDSAVRNRDWATVETAGKQLLFVWPHDVTGQIAMALALDATGRETEAAQYTGSLEHVTTESLWIALEFVKSLTRRRDFDGAERNLSVIRHRFNDEPRVVLVESQLHERRGETDAAIECCELVLSRPQVREAEAFQAALILRDVNRLELLVKHLERRYEESGFANTGLLRMYSLASVVGNHDPQEGIQVLSDLWEASPTDGYVVSDYATALVELGRTADARAVLERGAEDVPHRSRGYRALLETYALFFERQGKAGEAFQKYRDAISIAPQHLHLYRRFARCLLEAAAANRESGARAQEDSCLTEAKQVLSRLLQLAPLDSWAADAMHRAEQRTY